MDYKYIEQLLEKYWDCETSVEEEQMLRIFFRQKEIPANLLPYKSLFTYQEEEQKLKLGDDFDARILAEIERPVVKAKKLTLQMRFMPLFKAAAVMAFLFTVGEVVKHSMNEGSPTNIAYEYDQFEKRTQDPQVAYKADSVKAPLKEFSEKGPLNEQ